MDLSPATSSPFGFSQVLLVQPNVSAAQSFFEIFGDRRLDVNFDVCTSHRSAVRKLLASPYQVIISGAHLAEIDEFLLLTRAQALDAVVPLVITVATDEKASARRLLEQGAFDLIPTPPEHEQTVSTIRLALWHHKFNEVIAARDKALERYRRHIDDYPGNRSGDAFRTILTSIQQSVTAHDWTIRQIETSLKYLTDLAESVETKVHDLALTRLDRMYGLHPA